MNFPEELKYTNDHEWVRVEGDEALVGITEFAQSELGDVVFVEIETIGDELGSGDTFGTVEAVKTVSDLYMPVDGEVVAANEGLEDAPEKVNEDPYGDGWMIRIRLTDKSQLDDLLDAAGYKALIGH